MSVLSPEALALLLGATALAWLLQRTRDIPRPLLVLERIAGKSFKPDKIREMDKRLEALKIPVPAMSIATVQTGVVIVLLLLTLLAMFKSPPEALPLLIMAAAAHKSSGYILGKLEKRRREELSREFPRMVDNVRIFTKASDIYTALKTVHYSLRGRLAEEMRILSVDMEMNDLEKALANFSMRCGLRQAFDFSSVVLQAAWSGMEVDSILSNYSKTAYEKRLGEIRRRIKARPLLMTIIPAILLLSIMLLWLMPIYNSIINQLRSF